MSRFYLLIITLILSLQLPASASAIESVLMISSYHPGFPTFFQQVDGVKSVLDPLGINLDVEFMDSKRFYTQENIDNFKKNLEYKLKHNPPYDAVITADDNALIFVLDNKSQYFPKTPIVFCGVNNVSLAMEQNSNSQITGVIESVSMAETLRMAMEIMPEIHNFDVIYDGLPSSMADLNTFKSLKKDFPHVGFTEFDLSKITWKTLADKLHANDKNTAILLLAAYKDATGQHKLFDQGLRFIKYNTKSPIFHLWEHGMGQGVLGGKVISHYEQGRAAAKMVTEILDGASPGEISVMDGDSANKFIFDRNQLDTFSIPKSALPEGSKVINEPDTFFSHYLNEIIAISALVVIQALLIIYLFINRRYLNRVKRELKSNLEFFSSLFKYSTSIMLLINPDDGNIVDANQSASEFYGYEIDQLKSMNISQINTLSDQEVLKLADKALSKKELSFLFKHKLAGGETRDVEVKSGPIEIGNKKYLFSIIVDVTEKVRMQNELAKSEKRYRNLIENAPNIIMIIRDQRISFINRNGALTLGRLDPQVLLNTNIKSIISPESHNILADNTIRAESGQFSKPFEIVLHPLGLPEANIQAVVGPLNSGHTSSIVLIGVDITNLKKQQSKLLEYSRFVEGANDMMAIVDRDLRFRVVNNAYLRDRKRTRDDIIGRKVQEVLPQQTFKNYALPGMQRAFNGESCLLVIKEEDSSGTTYLSARYHPIYNENGEVLRVAVILTDITSQKEYEKNIFKAKREAEKSNLAKTEFLANMSHEIRTPLNGIMGMIQLMDTTELSREQQEYVLAAHKSCRNLTRLLSDLLILSDIESGNAHLEEKQFNLFELLNTARENFIDQASQKGIKLTVIPDNSMPRTLISDSVRIRHILFNIMANAVKFTDKGEVSLKVSMLPKDSAGRRRLLFEVHDTGIGIPDEMVEEIFEPFTQVEKSYTRKYQGAGLGLRIVKRLIEMLNGSLSIASEPDVGTSIYFTIQAKIEEQEALSKKYVPTRPEINKEENRILIAEDEAINRITLSKFLEKHGFIVTSVQDGSELFRELEKSDYACILMDIQMPNVNGVEATKMIRESKELGPKAHIPIIALTAYAMESDREKFIDLGMNEYLPKPLDLNKLLMTIRKVAA